ncbi:MAG: hypothetical protein ACQEVA_13325 [Myxococcota bacterium]
MEKLRDSPWIRYVALIALLSLLVLDIMFAHLSLRRGEAQMAPVATTHQRVLPSSEALAALFLNYNEVATDLVWIRALIYFGEQRKKRRNLHAMEGYAYTISELDPYFYKVYRWFADLYVNAQYLRDPDAIEKANHFLKRGMKFFPHKHELPFSAALNYIGYSRMASPERRLKEMDRALYFLRRTAEHSDAPPNLPALIRWFTQRKEQLEQQLGKTDDNRGTAVLSEEDKELYARMYLLAPDERVRKRIAMMLEQQGIRQEDVLREARYSAKKLARAQDETLPYLPVDLWMNVSEAGQNQ